ncbi:DUF2141 domain-containing protein [Parvularcula flava]|uniref:DUF2141 domain-containing protein n=1 Tax=Aquisalinus luteolus TaxID=1566827 RepID=A0A8J3EVX4_9PROT|nr:DUF2141 domain-containing protein [Aquisalinus luteolus]NHK29419.1 DUF2141 domain-containing protein [Aquisalinus luteolus]GGI02005.1 hypothetical protein GCM10011355_33990 [Aquisalinus luteolus]
MSKSQSLFTRLACTAVAGFLALGAAGAATAADVSITLTGVKEGGTLYVGLQTEDQFMSMETVGGESMTVNADGDVTISLAGIEPGTYAFSIWHDINGNGEFDMAPQGWPEDGWSAYNVTMIMGAPSFSQVSFKVDDAGFETTEPMIYPEFFTNMP